MITLPCALVAAIRPVFKRSLHLGNREQGPNLLLVSGPDGLRIRARNDYAAVEYHLPGDDPASSIQVPFAVLMDCRGGNRDWLTLRQESPQVATAEWTDKQIPQLVRYDVKPVKKQEFPSCPEAMADNDARLWSALGAAVEVTDPDSTRYVLGCLQLKGTQGQIVTADGCQLLVQAGYRFPWDEDLLVPGSPLFGCQGVVDDQPLSIGRTDDWLTLRSGPWTFHRRLQKEGRFPKAESVIPRQEDACSRVQVDPDDAVFLADALRRLPVDSQTSALGITIDLQEGLTIRAGGDHTRAPVELVLSRSAVDGQRLCLHTDRDYLLRAMRLGLRDLYFYGPEAPVQASDEQRTYLWASLASDHAVRSNHKAVRIDSVETGPQQSNPVKPASPSKRRPRDMAKDTNGNGKTHANDAASTPANGQANSNSSPDLIEQAEALRTTLRTGVSQLSDLINALKQQKKNTRNVQSALATLRQLENVAL